MGALNDCSSLCLHIRVVVVLCNSIVCHLSARSTLCRANKAAEVKWVILDRAACKVMDRWGEVGKKIQPIYNLYITMMKQ